jgi:3-oxoacyl-[acyl-carrier-protein] synthase II
MRKAVITGIGVLCSIGRDLDDFYNNLSLGKCGIGDISLFDTSGYRGRPGAQIHDDFIDPAISKGRRLSRCDVLGLMAAMEAVSSSRLDMGSVEPVRLATVIGSGAGGLLSGEQFKRAYLTGNKARPSLLVPFTSSSFTDLLAHTYGSRGPRSTISTACSSSATAMGYAMDMIHDDIADVVITGGSESLSETTFAGFNSLRAVDDVPCRPFDRERKGISLGEGAALFIVEDESSAKQRGATLFAEISGYGITGDAHHVTAPEPGGSGVVIAIDMALRSAGMDKEDIGYINAHGTGTQANDLAETIAIKSVFGQLAYDIPVSSTKSMIGHCLGAAGALEAAASILPFARGMLPPTANYKNRDPECDLNYLPEPVTSSASAVLSLSLAFGGNNTALILRKTS